jgi:hypothetical protein
MAAYNPLCSSMRKHEFNEFVHKREIQNPFLLVYSLASRGDKQIDKRKY